MICFILRYRFCQANVEVSLIKRNVKVITAVQNLMFLSFTNKIGFCSVQYYKQFLRLSGGPNTYATHRDLKTLEKRKDRNSFFKLFFLKYVDLYLLFVSL